VGLDYARVLKQPGSTFKPFVLLADLLQPDPMGLGTQSRVATARAAQRRRGILPGL